MNPDNHTNLGEVRLEEWKKAGQLIGATTMHHFGYEDGTLGNIHHVEITERIQALILELTKDRLDIEIEIMSMDLNGITGHIDHIVAGRSALLAYYRLKEKGLPLTRIRLACIPNTVLSEPNTEFVLMETGRTEQEINETIDARLVVNEVYDIIRTHHTQRSDGVGHIVRSGDAVAISHFIVK